MKKASFSAVAWLAMTRNGVPALFAAATKMLAFPIWVASKREYASVVRGFHWVQLRPARDRAALGRHVTLDAKPPR